MKTLTLYSRPDCHLCELMLRDLQGLLGGRAEVRRVDISGDLELIERYGLRIPVLVCGNEEISGYPLDAAAVQRFLASSS